MCSSFSEASLPFADCFIFCFVFVRITLTLVKMADKKEIHKNVEIKAKITNYDKIMAEVQTLCQSHGELIKQEDTFFNVPNGRLKLRKRSVSSFFRIRYNIYDCSLRGKANMVYRTTPYSS